MFQEVLPKRTVEKGTAAGERCEVDGDFGFCFEKWALLQHVCFLMGINSFFNHNSQFGVMENKESLTCPSTHALVICLQALYNPASTWLPRLIPDSSLP